MAGSPSLLKEAFARRFGNPAAALYRAPGRVNLIGEHTDYNLGFVLPVAIDLACFTAAAAAPGDRLVVVSENTGEERSWPVEAIAGLDPAGDWGDYVAGVARELRLAGYELRPARLLIHSTVPVGSGLSSSAALEVSVALALLGGRPVDRLDLARLCRRAENDFVGMPCGIMDQYASVFGAAGAAIRIDCRSLEHETVPLPAGVAVVAVNSMVKHELGQSAYRQRVAECAEAVELIRQRYPEVRSLRDIRCSELEAIAPSLGGIPLKRARHVSTENERVEAFVASCAAGDAGKLGSLFVASHRSLRDDYEVSCEELDFLVDTALALEGVLGARMTGGGFGGCTVNLVAVESAGRFAVSIAGAYRDRYGIEPAVYSCNPAAGASAL